MNVLWLVTWVICLRSFAFITGAHRQEGHAIIRAALVSRLEARTCQGIAALSLMSLFPDTGFVLGHHFVRR
jgi:hypothetical protein